MALDRSRSLAKRWVSNGTYRVTRVGPSASWLSTTTDSTVSRVDTRELLAQQVDGVVQVLVKIDIGLAHLIHLG